MWYIDDSRHLLITEQENPIRKPWGRVLSFRGRGRTYGEGAEIVDVTPLGRGMSKKEASLARGGGEQRLRLLDASLDHISLRPVLA